MADANGADFVTVMGEMELVALAEHTFTYADTIHAVVTVIPFQSHSVSLPIIDENTYYTREDLYFRRHPKRDLYCMPPPCHRMCSMHPDLTERHPAIPILRFCQECSLWLHIKCCDRADATGPSLLPPMPGRPVQPQNVAEVEELRSRGDISYTVGEWIIWTELLRLPIQRHGHKQSKWPLSFELVVARIRAQDQTYGCPDNVHEFLVDNFGLACHLRSFFDYFLGEFRAWRCTTYYTCPTCRSVI
ncbi:hypothetical protein OH77DRAFT_1413001 [Trametes cingulata]|nr:hypothetical protein OH77DRAFT_1413001 [Trametes cingulata]